MLKGLLAKNVALEGAVASLNTKLVQCGKCSTADEEERATTRSTLATLETRFAQMELQMSELVRFRLAASCHGLSLGKLKKGWWARCGRGVDR